MFGTFSRPLIDEGGRAVSGPYPRFSETSLAHVDLPELPWRNSASLVHGFIVNHQLAASGNVYHYQQLGYIGPLTTGPA